MNERRGFTLIELLTALIVVAIISSVAMMSTGSARQTARREAERVQAYIYRQMQRADRMHANFTLNINENEINTTWKNQAVNKEAEPLKASNGYIYEHNFNTNPCRYVVSTRRFDWPGTITIHGTDGKDHHVIIAGSTEGRIRISYKKP